MQRYRAKISGPLLDRIDLHVEMRRPRSFLSEHSGPQPESSESVRERVITARAIQQERSACTNAQLGPASIKAHCAIGTSDRKLLEAASQQLILSPRACLRVLKMARTLLDLEAAATFRTDHLAETISYRNGLTMVGQVSFPAIAQRRFEFSGVTCTEYRPK